MAYYTGTANDMPALRQALIDACTQPSEGWAWDGVNEVLSKGSMFLRLQVVSGHLTLLGRTSAVAGAAPEVVRIGQVAATPLTYPLIYEIFLFPGEVYLVINYSVDFYQWCAFGISTVDGMLGSGMWVGATLGSAAAGSGINITPTSGGSFSNDASSGALFYTTTGNWPAARNCWVHTDLDSQGWLMAQALDGFQVGIGATVPLIGLLPSAWNNEATLLPIRSYKVRPSSKNSLTADLEHARHTRVDNYDPGQVISLGEDRWKIFPWYRKNSAARDGGGGAAVNHSGTFGWAIRYEGP